LASDRALRPANPVFALAKPAGVIPLRQLEVRSAKWCQQEQIDSAGFATPFNAIAARRRCHAKAQITTSYITRHAVIKHCDPNWRFSYRGCGNKKKTFVEHDAAIWHIAAITSGVATTGTPASHDG
jgi:hypothetical protein